MKSILIVFVGAAILAAWQAVPPQPTQVIRFVAPATLPERAQSGSCQSPSLAAPYRTDSFHCSVEMLVLDPCFATPKAGQALCGVDPRKPETGRLVNFPAQASSAGSAPAARTVAWFVELADGSTCQPLVGTGREIEDLTEIYTCRFGLLGDADAVLGDLDTSAAVWTVRKVLINKKVEPQTIKAVTMAAVKTVWQ